MSRRDRLWAAWVLVAAAVLGGIAGWSMTHGNALEWAQSAPPGWQRTDVEAAFMSPSTLGELDAQAGSWDLNRYGVLRRPGRVESLQATVDLGREGQLWLLPAVLEGPEPLGLALQLESGQVPSFARLETWGRVTPQDCEGTLSPPGPGPYGVAVQAIDGGWRFQHDDERMTCSGDGEGVGIALQSGLRRVRLSDMAVDGAAVADPFTVAGGAGAAAVGAALVLCLAGVQLLVGTAPWLVLLTVLPLALCGLLLVVDFSGMHEALRIPGLRLELAAVVIGSSLAASAVLVVQTARLARSKLSPRVGWALAAGLALALAVAVAGEGGTAWIPMSLATAVGVLAGSSVLLRLLRREPFVLSAAAAGVLMLTLAAAVATLAAGVSHPTARVGFTLAGACVGLLVVVNANATRVRFFNSTSLLSVVAAMALAELATGSTRVAPFWGTDDPLNNAGTQSTLVQQFELLERAEHMAYPSFGYPVAPPTDTAPLRVVCLGGSSTGGAYQNTSIEGFYPARMQGLAPPGVQVVNQGVGGWNTLHIRLFADSALADLQPQVVTVYVGVNELVEVPVTYRELHAAWQSGDLRARSPLFEDLLLYQGLRMVVRSLRPSSLSVPPTDTEDNLRAVIASAQDAGAKVLLMSEGVQPRPDALDDYWSVMEALADADDVAFLHTAELLRPLGRSAFLDQNHLSDSGHERLAILATAELDRLGWLTPAPADE